MAKKPKKSEDASILDELVEATGVKRETDESVQDYAKRLALAVDKLGEDEWAALNEPAQLWVNAAVEATDAGKKISLPPGLEDDAAEPDADAVAEEEPDAADEAGESEAEEVEEVEEPAPKAGGKKKDKSAAKGKPPVAAAKVPDKKKPASKPAAASKAGGKKKAPDKKTVVAKPTKKAAKPASEKAPRAASSKEPRSGTKRAKLIEMLSQSKGATVAEIAKKFEWEPHTTRACISMLRKSGTAVDSEQDGKRGRVYKIAA